MSCNFLINKAYWHVYMQHAISFFYTRNSCKIAVDLDRNILPNFKSNRFIPNHHPGLIKSNSAALPCNISSALRSAVQDYPTKTLIKDSKRLNQYIVSRHPPPEPGEIRQKLIHIRKIDRKVALRLPETVTAEGTEGVRDCKKNVRKVIGKCIYTWKPLKYNKYKALVYAVSRSSQEYVILTKIFHEMLIRDPKFKPRSYFDFGSGVGTGMWAASTLWKTSIFEYYNIDTSIEMHDLSDLILRGGKENQKRSLQNVYYRKFLPTIKTKYDLILASFSLFELPNCQKRKEVMLNLWRRCSGYLVIVEEGSYIASKVVNEIREFLLTQEEEELRGSVLSPCPHDKKCPRLSSKDLSPCNFEISYAPLTLEESHFNRKRSRYSYIVLKKGCLEDGSKNWPRLVRPTLMRSKHAVCRLCTSEGNLQEIIFTKSKHGSQIYRCARATRWGDRLPIEIGIETKEN